MSADTGGLDESKADELVRAPRSERVESLFGFEPVDPHQRDLLDTDAQKIVVNWGRRSGKTKTAGALAADYALCHAGEDVAIYAPYAETAKEMFREVKGYLDAMGEPGSVGIEKDNEMTYELSNGSRILARTLGSEAQRGKGPSCIVIDEASIVDEESVTRVVRPMTITHPDYKLILTSTPSGQNGYFWKKSNDDGWWYSHATAWDNPYADEGILKEIRDEEDDLTWRQEYLAEFVETGNAYLPSSLVAPCMPGRHDDVAEPPAVTRAEGAKAWLGVDPATSGKDRAVYTSIDEYGRVFDITAYQTQTIPEIVGTIKRLHAEHDYAAIVVESNGLGEGVAGFTQADIPRVEEFYASSKSKQALYATFRRYLENEDLTLPNDERLFSETTSLVFDETANGIIRVKHPPGGHDDYPDSLALALRGWHTDLGGPIKRTNAESRTQSTRTSRQRSRSRRGSRNSRTARSRGARGRSR